MSRRKWAKMTYAERAAEEDARAAAERGVTTGARPAALLPALLPESAVR
jgi:hypothetical protein